MSIITKLTNEDDIMTWRAAKTKADKDKHYRNKLGCVGEPIADAFDKVLRYIPCLDDRADCQAILDEAAAESRVNLRDYVNDARQNGADEILSDIEACVTFDSYDLEVDPSDTLAEVAEKGFDLALMVVNNQCWTVTEIADEDL